MGYVGCGFMAQKVHIPNFLSIPECELVALAEMRQELGRKVKDRLRIPRLYATHKELAADPEIEAVALSAGFSVQGEIARDLLLAGKHVFMEKPMAVSIEQGQELVQAAESAGKKLMIGYMKRYDAGNELAKDLVCRARQTGELGKLEYVRNHGFCGDWTAGIDVPMDATDESMPPAPPMRTPAWLPQEWVKPYLGYLQQYTHNINLMRWFLDAGNQVRVKAVDLDDDGYTGVVILDMNGTRAILESGRLSYYSWDEHTQIYFTDGWVKAWAPPLLKKNEPAEVEVYRGGEVQEFSYPLPRARWSWSYKREAEAFVRAVLNDEAIRSSGQDTLTDVRLFEEIYQIYLKQRGVLES